MSFMIAFGIASIMLCVGMIIRLKVPFIRNMLVPASVIAGILGMIVMNTNLVHATDAELFTIIVTQLFTITFISIGLTSNNKRSKEKSIGKYIVQGAVGLGMLWNILYALTPAVGAIVILFIGSYFGMDTLYGLLIPFAFTQGPGQAATFGSIFEQQYGIENAAMVGLTFAAIGFIVCFLVGVPLAKYGLKRGLAKKFGEGEVKAYMKRGYYSKSDKRDSIGQETVFSGNMDTMTFHFTMIGICYVLALGMAHIISLIPVAGPSLSGMLFIYGMLAGYFVKMVLKKLRLDHLLDNTFQTKITGWSTDYLVVCSFMAVQFSIIGQWIVPIIIESIVITILTVAVILYFGKRLGGDNDFSRTLGLLGTSLGTVPSGIALVRIIEPSLRSTTAIELGMMNIPMMLSYVTVATIMMIMAGTLSITVGILWLLVPVPIYLVLLKVFKLWGKRTYDFKENSGTLKSKEKSLA
ncbi:sodium/glutamate symporter [Oceanobacillus sp. J11TS1]|uniref:sodium/glutamate symporter n=1 Tax=Oceanobacillus sp. J11TS1 TaxID=2807191 RepID=UPI001B2AB73D|nr:sodium/glutamate symporter [Oceanobacillus sp. J11TS1]GIO24124.1 sodium:glutamate symporter [Oceanobacillus sp. J11TS1]